MNLKSETIEKVRSLSKDPEFKSFFNELDNLNYSTELVDELTDMFIVEMELHPENREKLNFALRLAFLAGRGSIRES